MAVSFRAQVSDFTFTINTSPFTVVGVDIGTPSTDRVVALLIVLAYAAGQAIDRNPTSVTIGGISATKGVSNFDMQTGLDLAVSIWSASVPTGATANVDISVADDAAGVSYSIGSWALTGVTNLVSDTATSLNTGTSPATLSVDVANGSAVIAGLFEFVSSAVLGITWTGVTEDYDVDLFVGAFGASAGSFSAVGTETPRTVTAASITPANSYMLGASAVWPSGSVVTQPVFTMDMPGPMLVYPYDFQYQAKTEPTFMQPYAVVSFGWNSPQTELAPRRKDGLGPQYQQFYTANLEPISFVINITAIMAAVETKDTFLASITTFTAPFEAIVGVIEQPLTDGLSSIIESPQPAAVASAAVSIRTI